MRDACDSQGTVIAIPFNFESKRKEKKMSDGVKFIFKTLIKVPCIICVIYAIFNIYIAPNPLRLIFITNE